MIALEMLGLPCYHMRDMMADRERSVPQWRAALEGNGPWDELFEGKESVVDWPGSYHWRELIEVYPDAKVLLSVRSAESWVESMNATIGAIWFGDNLMHHLVRAQYNLDPQYKEWIDLLGDMWDAAGVVQGGDEQRMAETMEQWNHSVIDGVPADRLLVWHPKDGWEPLCELLDLPVPDSPVPNVNDTENFQKNLMMRPAIEKINEWWEENGDLEDAADKRPAGPAAASA
jgi:hypothetical protein